MARHSRPLIFHGYVVQLGSLAPVNNHSDLASLPTAEVNLATSRLELAAHRSAFGLTEEMVSSPPAGRSEMLDTFRPAFEREVFVLGGTRIPIAWWPLNDFFEGMTSAELERVTTSIAPA